MNPVLLVAEIIVACLSAGALGLAIGTGWNPRQVPLIFSLIVIPITFLGCIYYPWASLHTIRWLQILILVNPLVYVSEGFAGRHHPQPAAHAVAGEPGRPHPHRGRPGVAGDAGVPQARTRVS